MIDIHAHILKDINENRSEVESKTLLKKMIQNDFDTIIAISEYHSDIPDLKNITNRENGLDLLLRNVYEEADSVTLMTGSEVSLDQNIFSLLDQKVIQLLGNSNYLLVKYPKGMNLSKGTSKIITLRSSGIVPILTNIERTFRYVRAINTLIQAGALIQLDYSSILGLTEKEYQHRALKLLRKGMVDLLGSNISHENHPILSEKFHLEEQLKRYLGNREYERLVIENPTHVIQNESIENLNTQKIKKL